MPRRSARALALVMSVLALAGCGTTGAPATTALSSTAPPTTAAPPSASAAPSASPIQSHAAALPGRIAFGRYDASIDDFQVFTMLADGSDVRPLLPGPHEGPSWSPDGTMISVTSFEDGNFLKILRPDGSLVRDLALPDPTIGLGCDAWSPDGTRFTCEGWDDSHPDRIGLYSVRASDGGDLRRLTSPADGNHDLSPTYSPDGTRIAFAHVTDTQREKGRLWIMNVDGTEAHQASDVEIGWTVRWSPDGNRILADAEGSLVTFDASDLSLAPKRVTDLNQIAFGGSWSPDGSRIVYSMIAMGHQVPDIATVFADGTDPWVLTTDPAKEELAAWGLPTP